MYVYYISEATSIINFSNGCSFFFFFFYQKGTFKEEDMTFRFK